MSLQKSACPTCKNRVSFTKEQAGSSVTCPHCGSAMVLTAQKSGLLKVFLIVATCVFAVAILGRIATSIITGEQVGTLFMAGLFAVGAVVAFLWLIFPVFMLSKMNELIKEVRQLRLK